MAGANTSASDIVPNFSSASSHVATVPGTPTERPLYRASLNGSGTPFSRNDAGCMAAGAVSRPSMVVTPPPAVRRTMKPPPPIPHEKGSVTPSTAAEATAASTALPPRRRMSIPACVASFSTEAAAPPVPIDVGGPEPLPTSATAGIPNTSAAAVTSATSTYRPLRRMVSPSDALPVGDPTPWPRTRQGTVRRFILPRSDQGLRDSFRPRAEPGCGPRRQHEGQDRRDDRRQPEEGLASRKHC